MTGGNVKLCYRHHHQGREEGFLGDFQQRHAPATTTFLIYANPRHEVSLALNKNFTDTKPRACLVPHTTPPRHTLNNS